MKNSVTTFILLSLIFSSCCWFKDCDKDSECPISIKYDSKLSATYNNTKENGPSLTLDLNNSSEIINVESTPIITEINGRIQINYPAVTLKKNKEIYKIDDISTEVSSICWIVDDENKLTWTYSKSIDIVLVLDVSSSLGENIETVKSSAKNVVNNILNQNPLAKIAIVKFSRGNVSTNFSSSKIELTSFINNNPLYNSPDIGSYPLEGRNETALYEAIAEAIFLLNTSNARGKGILTFTDGVNNFHFNPENQFPEKIIGEMKISEIANYTIGFDGNQGGVDKLALEKISVNGDFSFPKSTSDLNQVFESFSNNVATVYDLIYNTNTSELAEPIKYRFLFKTTKIN